MGIPIETEPVTEILDGGMDDLGNWTIGAGWNIHDGIATYTVADVVLPNDFYLAQDIVFAADKLYRFKWDIFNLNLSGGNKAGANLWGNITPGWDVPGTHTYYFVDQGGFPLFKNVALASTAAPPADSYDCDNVSVIDVVQYMLNIYGFNPADVSYVEFNQIAGSVYQFIISNFSTPLSVWIKADVDEF